MSSDQALRRVGLGRRGSEPGPNDVRAWLEAQLDAPDPMIPHELPSTENAAFVMRRYQEAKQAGAPLPMGFADLFGQDMSEALKHATVTDLPFRERLVWFWSNHFTVSGRAGNWVFGLAGPYIREAIRPHVTGRFVDMVKAVMRHPAMLYYLDNQISDGPHSPLGIRQHRGLNENLARECLELHTLGVDGGYTQADVTAFAAILTGRTVNDSGDHPGFVFNADAHEPGPHSFMGHAFPEGFDGSESVLAFIAAQPSTHRHIARRLVQHFIADVPPPNCVDRVAAVLADTGGDLKLAVMALVNMPEAWEPLTKFRAPAEYVVAVLRALDLPPPR